jgi:hypothetical protein
MKRRGRVVARAGAFAVLALVLSACIKLDMDLSVHSDDTVDGTVIFALSKQLIALSGQSPEDLLGTDAPVPSDAEGVTTEPYEDDKFQGQRFTFDAVPLAQLNQGGTDEDALRITREGDTYTVNGALDLSSGATGATGLTGFPGAEELFQGAELRIRLTFPGEVLSSNGQVDGNTVTWVPKVGERLELQATASAIDNGAAGGGNTLLFVIVGAAIVVVAIVVGVLLARRRRSGAAEPAPAPMDEGAIAAPPPAATPSTAVPVSTPPEAAPPPASASAPSGAEPSPPPPPPSEPPPEPGEA